MLPKVGWKYRINATGTNSREWWEILEVRENAKGHMEVVAKGDKTPHNRTFLVEQVGEMNKPKQIISESVEFVQKIGNAEMWIERIDWWPPQERRGRKPKASKVAA
jgi:hypothetical protein